MDDTENPLHGPAGLGGTDGPTDRDPLLVMAEQPAGARPCSIAAALDLLGERWSLLVVRELGYGVHRFAKIAGYTGAARDILTDRLRKLEAAGIVERKQYSEHPPRYEYHLTQAGRELRPVLLALKQWGDKWAVEEPALLLHHDCGHALELDYVCHHCGKGVERGSLTPKRGSTGRNVGE